jgi:hypothetical protein
MRFSLVFRLPRALALSVTACCVVLAAPGDAVADGMAYKSRDRSLYHPVQEREQVAVIEHENGRQTLTIAINLEEAEEETGLAYDEHAVWIFPVRGQPDDITIDIDASLPQLEGEKLESAAAKGLQRLFAPAYLTQIYPVLGCCLIPGLGRARGLPATALHDEVEKYGLRAQLITSGSRPGLEAWLQTRQTPIPTEQLASFEPYLNDEHALVVVSIASAEEIATNFPQAYTTGARLGRWPCLRVEFPTHEPFYPMIPTSGYGHAHIACRLYVAGFVELATPVPYARNLRASHILAEPEGAALDTPIGNYTIFRGEVRADELTADLVFRPARDMTTKAQLWTARLTMWPGGLLLTFGFVALFSYLSAGLAGLALFHRWRGFAVLGLWNLATLIGLAYAARSSLVVTAAAGPETRWCGDVKRASESFAILFTVIFMSITTAAYALVASFLGVDIIS